MNIPQPPPLSHLSGKTVLITGASGFTGSLLTEKLVALGANVRAIARRSSDLSTLEHLPVSWFRGDVYSPEVVNAASEGAQYVFHVAAMFRQAGIEDAEYRRVHVESTQLLAQNALKNPSFERFVHVSTMGVHGHITSPPGDEESPYAPGDEYQRTKLEAELWIREFASEKRIPWTVIRPMGIFGPGDQRLLKVFRMAKWPVYPILGNGKCYYHLIHVDDLTDAIIHSSQVRAAEHGVFLIGNTEAIQLTDMIAIIADELGTHPRALRLPVTPFFLAGDLCEAICRPLGIEPPLYRRRVAFYTKDRWFRTDRMQEVLGFKPQHNNEQGLRETARWYRSHGWL